MDIKRYVAWSMIVWSFIIWSPSKVKSETLEKTNANKLTEVVYDNKSSVNWIITWQLVNTEKIQDTQSSNVTDILSEQVEQKLVFKKKISEMKWSPLEMRWIYDKGNLAQFLWLNQVKVIFEKYNPDIVKYDEKWKLITLRAAYEDEEIVIPRIFDWLENEFEETIEELKLNSKYAKKIWDKKELVIVKKISTWRFALWFYKDWKLFMATHVSPWTWSKTTEWIFKAYKNDKLFLRKRSIKYKLSPMPYAIQFNVWEYLHHWESPDGKKKSHWCIRMPWIIHEELYKYIKTWTLVIIQDMKEKSKKGKV